MRLSKDMTACNPTMSRVLYCIYDDEKVQCSGTVGSKHIKLKCNFKFLICK